MQLSTELSVAGMRALSLKAGITMLYFGPALWLISSVTFSSPLPFQLAGNHREVLWSS
jgi:hypothetical protein